MTVNILRVPGDYQIQARNGGIVLDAVSTNSNYTANPGAITIYGNLDVIGNMTYVESTETKIKDNIIFLNSGEQNQYVTKGLSGIAISRGADNTLTNAASVLYNDTVSWSYDNQTGPIRGIWEFKSGNTATNVTSAIRVNAIRIGGEQNFLNLLGSENPTAVLNVKGTTNYHLNVIDDDDIPNKKYVDQAAYTVGFDNTKRLVVGWSQVKLTDPNIPPTDPYYSSTPKLVVSLGTFTNSVFAVDLTTAEFQGLTISDTNINAKAGRSSESIRLTPWNTGTVQINGALTLNQVVKPTTSTYVTHIYNTSTVGGGGTGLYFVNTRTTDELVSRRRAIIYGIIF